MESLKGYEGKTPVTILQEFLAQKSIIPKYVEPVQVALPQRYVPGLFRVSVSVGEIFAVGEGKSKKEAKHNAAEALLRELVKVPELNEAQDEGPSGRVVQQLCEACRKAKLGDPHFSTKEVNGNLNLMFLTVCEVKMENLVIEAQGTGLSRRKSKYTSAQAMLQKIEDHINYNRAQETCQPMWTKPQTQNMSSNVVQNPVIRPPVLRSRFHRSLSPSVHVPEALSSPRLEGCFEWTPLKLSISNEALTGCTSNKSRNMSTESDYRPLDEGFATRAIHAGQDPDQWTSGIVIPPIHMGTTFKQDAPAKHRGYDYGRSGNPSRAALETCLASIENAKYSLAFASGLAAANAVLSLLKSGDHIISSDDVYGGMNRFFRNIGATFGMQTDFIDLINPDKLLSAIKPSTRLVWMESPTNPLLKVMDIPKLTKIIRSISENIIIVVDNTFLTPYLQRPLEMGADISVYSLTKYMNGHSDVIMGAATMNRTDLYEKLVFIQNSSGLVPSPFDCFLVNRSLKTLEVRMDKHMVNATEVASFLESHSMVEKVIFPGSSSHPQHGLVKKLWSGVSGMISFYLKGGLDQSNKFLSSLKVFTLAESLGGFESLAELPSVMTHASVPEDMRQELGITDNLIRLSIGLEAPKDLISDIDQALKLASQV